MNKEMKRYVDYLLVLVNILVLFLVLKSVLNVYWFEVEHLVMNILDALRFYLEIGLLVFYFKNVSLRDSNNKRPFFKILCILFFWVLFYRDLQKK